MNTNISLRWGPRRNPLRQYHQYGIVEPQLRILRPPLYITGGETFTIHLMVRAGRGVVLPWRIIAS